ncbi:glycoside hydrolase superfamily, partial [Phaeosphaeriaceae sp. PMI808]
LPNQLDLSVINHLVFAFASMDSKTFSVRPMHHEDEELYKKFLDLPNQISKWIGLGGWEFNDPGDTQFTWSDMTSSKENRAVFIDSLRQFLSKWKFGGIDIDWEWPGDESRGGRPDDGRNQVELVRELRQAFGSDFGISVAIPSSYEHMKNMDPKALEAHVNWLNILTFDFHGPWDAKTPGLGPQIKPHTDLKEIDNALNTLWKIGMDPKKINLGVANYGRGYTVADRSCMHYGCTFTGPSRQGSCTLQEGVLSFCEIRSLIKGKNLSPNIIAGGAEVLEITWDDQWVAFDDMGTFGKKLELANERCLGGTALWALDYD